MPERDDERNEKKRESGQPGGGAGRRDDVRGNPIYPGSGPWPEGEATTMRPGDIGGHYEESGRSEINDPARHEEAAERGEGERGDEGKK